MRTCSEEEITKCSIKGGDSSSLYLEEMGTCESKHPQNHPPWYVHMEHMYLAGYSKKLHTLLPFCLLGQLSQAGLAYSYPTKITPVFRASAALVCSMPEWLGPKTWFFFFIIFWRFKAVILTVRWRASSSRVQIKTSKINPHHLPRVQDSEEINHRRTQYVTTPEQLDS